MKLTRILFTGIIISSIWGCSSFESPQEVEPTLSSVQSSKDSVQLYKRTAYLESDFKQDGTLRKFNEYDYSVESSPCTVLPGAKVRPKNQDVFYTLKTEKNGQNVEFLFECRARLSSRPAAEHRLFLIGSYADCKTRAWNYKDSLMTEYRQISNTCANVGYTFKGNEEVEKKWHNFINKKS